MNILSEIINVPILQALGVVLVIAAAERMGIPLVTMLRSLMKLSGNGLEKKVDQLNTHFNHETTELLTEIRDSLKENFNTIHTKHSEWDRRGIPTEDCQKNK